MLTGFYVAGNKKLKHGLVVNESGMTKAKSRINPPSSPTRHRLSIAQKRQIGALKGTSN
jgi:hypothetical protein